MNDARENILVRLQAIATAVSGLRPCLRNVVSVEDLERPVTILDDGDETVQDSDNPQREIQRSAMFPRLMILQPEIRLLVQTTSGMDVGPALSAYRRQLVHAVLIDSTLIAMTTNGWGAKYMGASSVIAEGRRLNGIMRLLFDVPYVLKPADLV